MGENIQKDMERKRNLTHFRPSQRLLDLNPGYDDEKSFRLDWQGQLLRKIRKENRTFHLNLHNEFLF